MKVGIVGAMDIEVDYLKSLLVGAQTHTYADMQFCEGMLNGTPAVVVMCGIGKVNAALCVQVLVDRFDVTHVINTGVAGSLDARIDIGDMVVSTDVVHHDMNVEALGYALGQVPNMEHFSFAADEHLRAEATRVAHEVAPDVTVYEGRVASGDQFVSSAEQKDFILSTFEALCCEMEGAAIAHACVLNAVPFVIVRVISDKADGSAHVDYPTFKVQAAHNCAALVEHMVQG